MRRIWIGAGLLVIGGAAVVWGLALWGGDTATVIPPPILPSQDAPTLAVQPVIPQGFLESEPRSTAPLGQEGFSWTRADNVRLPPQIDPCGEGPTGTDAVAGVRQVALVSPTLWKSERLVVYRDVGAATHALATLRDALQRCARHDEGNGISTTWTWKPLDLGEEALFVTGQRYRGTEGVPGNHRGIVMRQGRALVLYVDFGQRTAPAALADMPSHRTDAQAMAAKLGAAAWAK